MECKIKDLYELQNTLDNRIFEQHGVTRLETMTRRQLALLVEIGELANETRCFKFWSNKGPSTPDIILEEYADGIHFLLSLGIDLGDECESLTAMEIEGSQYDALLMIYDLANEFFKHCSLKSYHILFEAYLGLGGKLGLSAEAIRTYYFKKNQKNHDRQDANY